MQTAQVADKHGIGRRNWPRLRKLLGLLRFACEVPAKGPRGVHILGHRFFHSRTEATRKTVFEVLFHGRSFQNLAKAQRSHQFEAVAQLRIAGIGTNQAELGESIYICMAQLPEDAEQCFGRNTAKVTLCLLPVAPTTSDAAEHIGLASVDVIGSAR